MSVNKTILLTFFSFFLAIGLNAQNSLFRFVFTADIGSHFQRGGVLFQNNIIYKNWETIAGVEIKFSLKGFGPQRKSTELVLHGGLSFGHGSYSYYQYGNSRYLPFQLFRKRRSKFNYGYVFNYYFDKHNTSQGTGTFRINIVDFYLISENDLFGNLNGKDQYRTGALGIYYQIDDLVLGAKTILWTGQTRCASMKKIRDSDFPSRHGFKSIVDCLYSNLSHGIISMDASYSVNQHLMPSINIGWEDEKIRNAVQNKFIHDMPFFPQKWNTAENAHIPMIDKQGEPYLYKPEQEIKEGSLFLQFGLNHGWFY